MSNAGHTDILPGGAQLNVTSQVALGNGRVINNYTTLWLCQVRDPAFCWATETSGTLNNRSSAVINIPERQQRVLGT